MSAKMPFSRSPSIATLVPATSQPGTDIEKNTTQPTFQDLFGDPIAIGFGTCDETDPILVGKDDLVREWYPKETAEALIAWCTAINDIDADDEFKEVAHQSVNNLLKALYKDGLLANQYGSFVDGPKRSAIKRSRVPRSVKIIATFFLLVVISMAWAAHVWWTHVAPMETIKWACETKIRWLAPLDGVDFPYSFFFFIVFSVFYLGTCIYRRDPSAWLLVLHGWGFAFMAGLFPFVLLFAGHIGPERRGGQCELLNFGMNGTPAGWEYARARW